MHLWPSTRIRDSFKLDYLRKLEWNLQRMKREKESSRSINQNLLDGQEGAAVNGNVPETPNSPKAHKMVLVFFRDTLMLLSCCFCCFCCGACEDKEANYTVV